MPPRSPRQWTAISAAALAAVSGAYALWRMPLQQISIEQQLMLPQEEVRDCIGQIASVPTEYVARMAYRECLLEARSKLDYEIRLNSMRKAERPKRCKPSLKKKGEQFSLPDCAGVDFDSWQPDYSHLTERK